MDVARLAQLKQAQVLVVGDVMLDRYFFGDTERISPEAPVPVVRVSGTEDRAGGAANVARNIAHLGGQVGILGLVGQDAGSTLLADILRRDGVRSELLTMDGISTITKTRIISRHQQVVRLDQESSFAETLAVRLTDAALTLLESCNTLVISDYNKGALQDVSRLIERARSLGKQVLVDPKQKDFSVYRGASLITPNLMEFRVAGGRTGSEDAMVSSARDMLKKAGIDAMLLTRSEQGMSLITRDSHHHFPAEALEISDVTGAGDTVIATLAAFVSAGFPVSDAAWMANQAAGIVVGKLGAATVSAEELQQRLLRKKQNRHMTSGNAEEALAQIALARKAGERIVFTNGCFDILHAGHVRYLNQARALGDRLVVGLNADASVRRLKGSERPVNGYEDRAEVLKALACVDWVLPFGDDPAEQDTPEQLIRHVNPQVLVKGGDYTVDTIVGADFVQQQGGEVVIMPLLEGRSTTAVINKVRG